MLEIRPQLPPAVSVLAERFRV